MSIRIDGTRTVVGYIRRRWRHDVRATNAPGTFETLAVDALNVARSCLSEPGLIPIPEPQETRVLAGCSPHNCEFATHRRQGHRVRAEGDLEVWIKPLASGASAIGLFNRGQASARIGVRWSDLGVPASPRVRDLWANADLGRVATEYAADVEAHGVALLRVEP